MTRCITCWDQALLSSYDDPNHTLLGNLHTDKGKARIDGIESVVCEDEFVDSANTPLLGVSVKMLDFGMWTSMAGSNLVGMGYEAATIQTDLSGGEPGEAPTGIDGAAVIGGLSR